MPLRLDARVADFAQTFAGLLAARRESATNVDAVVTAIIEDVRRRGDVAVIEYTERFDRLKLTPATMRVADGEIVALDRDGTRAVFRAGDSYFWALAGDEEQLENKPRDWRFWRR